MFNTCYINDLIKYTENQISEGEIKFLSSKALGIVGNMNKKMLGFDLEEVDQMALEYKANLN